MNEFNSRINSLVAQLPEDVDGALVTSQVSRCYLTGYNTDTGFLFITKNGSAFVTDFRYIEAANAALEGVCEAVCYSKLGECFAQLCERFGAKKLLIEHERVTLSEADMLSSLLNPCCAVKDNALDDILNAMRISKSRTELELVRAAQEVTEKSYLKILTLVKEGVSERDLALELEFEMRKNGAERVAFDLIIAAGTNGSMPHAVPGNNKIKRGDFITFDIGSVVGGYHSDMTRTVAYGNPSDEQKHVYNTVLKAQLAACEYLENGGTGCAEADKVARDIITEAGFGHAFGHSLGHGVGLEIHETPRLSTAAKSTLSAGNIVTVEPGIYIEGKYGVRIEDMMYITENSAVNLTHIEKKLVIL